MSAVAVEQLRVVVADDTAAVRALVVALLAADGRFEVVAQAADGDAAVDLVTSRAPDALVLDLSLPGIDGLEVLRRLRRRAPAVRVVVLSGFRAGEFAHDALALGASAYVEKGVELDRIATVVAEACGPDAPSPAVLVRAHTAGGGGATPAPTAAPVLPTAPSAPVLTVAEAERMRRRDGRPGAVLALLVAATVLVLAQVQGAARDDVRAAFERRAEVAAEVIAGDLGELLGRLVSAVDASDRSAVELAAIADALGSRNIGVFDPSSTLVAASDPDLVGRTIADTPHVTAALRGDTGVTDARPAQLDQTRIIAAAAPLPGGGEVVSTSFATDDTPFADQLALVSEDTALALLVDSTGEVLAEHEQLRETIGARPDVAALLAPDGAPGWAVTSTAVAGTSWRVVLATPASDLSDAAGGWLATVPWVLIALLAAAGTVGVAQHRRGREDARELASSNGELARTNADLEQFTWVATHDLQAPLRTVTRACGLLEQHHADDLDEQAVGHVRSAVDAAVRTQQLLHDLLRYAGSGRPGSTDPAHLDVVVAVEQARDAVADVLADAGAVLRLPMQSPVALVDGAQLAQVVADLLTNACTFRHPDRRPEIQVAVAREGPHVHLTVTDNGIGIPEEHLEDVFGLFHQLDGDDGRPGTGIGLAICRRVVERNRGRMWASSHLGEGTTFHVLLPAVDVEASSTTP